MLSKFATKINASAAASRNGVEDSDSTFNTSNPRPLRELVGKVGVQLHASALETDEENDTFNTANPRPMRELIRKVGVQLSPSALNTEEVIEANDSDLIEEFGVPPSHSFNKRMLSKFATKINASAAASRNGVEDSDSTFNTSNPRPLRELVGKVGVQLHASALETDEENDTFNTANPRPMRELIRKVGIQLSPSALNTEEVIEANDPNFLSVPEDTPRTRSRTRSAILKETASASASPLQEEENDWSFNSLTNDQKVEQKSRRRSWQKERSKRGLSILSTSSDNSRSSYYEPKEKQAEAETLSQGSVKSASEVYSEIVSQGMSKNSLTTTKSDSTNSDAARKKKAENYISQTIHSDDDDDDEREEESEPLGQASSILQNNARPLTRKKSASLASASDPENEEIIERDVTPNGKSELKGRRSAVKRSRDTSIEQSSPDSNGKSSYFEPKEKQAKKQDRSMNRLHAERGSQLMSGSLVDSEHSEGSAENNINFDSQSDSVVSLSQRQPKTQGSIKTIKSQKQKVKPPKDLFSNADLISKQRIQSYLQCIGKSYPPKILDNLCRNSNIFIEKFLNQLSASAGNAHRTFSYGQLEIALQEQQLIPRKENHLALEMVNAFTTCQLRKMEGILVPSPGEEDTEFD